MVYKFLYSFLLSKYRLKNIVETNKKKNENLI